MSTRTLSPTTEAAAKTIAMWVVGGGIIGLVAMLTVVPLADLALYCLYVLLPIAAILVGLGLISSGTMLAFKTLLTSGLSGRVKAYVEELRAEQEQAQQA